MLLGANLHEFKRKLSSGPLNRDAVVFELADGVTLQELPMLFKRWRISERENSKFLFVDREEDERTTHKICSVEIGGDTARLPTRQRRLKGAVPPLWCHWTRRTRKRCE